MEPGALRSGNNGLAELQLSLEKHISQQRTGYGGKAHSSCPEQHPGDVDMDTWHTSARTSWREWEKAFQEGGGAPACLSIQGLGRRAIGVGWESDTAGQYGPGYTATSWPDVKAVATVLIGTALAADSASLPRGAVPSTATREQNCLREWVHLWLRKGVKER